MSLLVFGDQTVDTFPFLREILFRAKSSALCSSFLRKVNAILREEVSQLPYEARQSIPSFSDVRELHDRYHNSKVANTGVDSALLCISQLAHYIRQVCSLAKHWRAYVANNRIVQVNSMAIANWTHQLQSSRDFVQAHYLLLRWPARQLLLI